MATVLDVGILSYFNVIFPALLVFALVYALLHKTKLLGESAVVNAFVGIIAAFMILLSDKALQIVNFMIPWFAIAIIFLILLVLLFRVLGAKEESIASAIKDKIVYWTILGIAIVIFAVALGNVFGQEALEAGQGSNELVNDSSSASTGAYEQNIWSIISNPKILGMIVIFAIAVFAIALLTG